MTDDAQVASELLDCREGATAREIRAAYRRAVRTARPDTGAVDGDWVTRAQAARDQLLVTAAPERRRRDRGRGGVPDFRPLRRATWSFESAPGPAIDVQL